jgi:hypothetical protein
MEGMRRILEISKNHANYYLSSMKAETLTETSRKVEDVVKRDWTHFILLRPKKTIPATPALLAAAPGDAGGAANFSG